MDLKLCWWKLNNIVNFIKYTFKLIRDLFFLNPITTLHSLKRIAYDLFLKKSFNVEEKKYLLIGEDNVNWSLNKDRKYAEYFLKLNKVEMTKNLLFSSHVFSISYDIILQSYYL